jgi:glutaredoxin
MITIYTTETCPKCKILKKKLSSKGVDFEEIWDVDVLKSLDIFEVPVLEVDGKYLEFSEANEWVNNL